MFDRRAGATMIRRGGELPAIYRRGFATARQRSTDTSLSRNDARPETSLLAARIRKDQIALWMRNATRCTQHRTVVVRSLISSRGLLSNTPLLCAEGLSRRRHRSDLRPTSREGRRDDRHMAVYHVFVSSSRCIKSDSAWCNGTNGNSCQAYHVYSCHRLTFTPYIRWHFGL